MLVKWVVCFEVEKTHTKAPHFFTSESCWLKWVFHVGLFSMEASNFKSTFKLGLGLHYIGSDGEVACTLGISKIGRAHV